MDINVKRKKFVFIDIDGRVLAESSKECSDNKDSSVTRVDVDACWTNESTKATAELYLKANKQEKASKSHGEIRRSYFLKSNEMNMNMRERESFLAHVKKGGKFLKKLQVCLN